MSNGSLSKRYARAIFSIASENNSIEQYNTALSDFVEVLTQNNAELLNALTSPAFKIEERKQVANVVTQKMALEQMLCNFINLLIDKDRLVLIEEISSFFNDMTDAHMGRVRATVQTAKELSDSERQDVAQTLANASEVSIENLIVEYSINPDIIGGIWARVGDKTYDATIRSKIRTMRQTLLNHNN